MAEPLASEHATNFTSVNPAITGTCERCGNIAVLRFMHSQEPGKTGRNLCPKCYQYYLNKAGTVRRSSAGVPQVHRKAGHQHDVHKQIAQAQRGSV